MRLEGKVCVVTGGASGIGEAICELFHENGARVVVADIDAESAARLASRLSGEARAMACDVASSAEVDRMFQDVKARFGRVDILVNNAGIVGVEEYRRAQVTRARQIDEEASGMPPTPLRATIGLNDDQWHRMIDTHLSGTFFCTRAALRMMEETGGGSIINISSINGVHGGVGNAHYSAAKAGILGFTRAVAKEVIGQGIRVNAIAPGFVDTPLRETIAKPIRDSQIAATPIGRAATAREVAKTALFLASDDSSYYVGSTLHMNGGYLTV